MVAEQLTLGSLFSGSGSFELAGLLSGTKPLWLSEIEPYPLLVTYKRLPNVKQYGDVSKLDGAKLAPVDIITFGSPCQDMSIAGKRAGLDGSRSNLFYEAVRIIKEMRKATKNEYPKYIVWENVPGAFSSNRGEDFRKVLEEICRIKDEKLSVPESEKWSGAGEILGDDFSVAWRVLDAQYFGVPQRRRRIYLVGDLRGERAGKILFESESVPRNFKQSSDQKQNSAHGVENRLGETGKKQRGVNVKVYENHSQDTRFTELSNVAPTVLSTYGTGGNNQPFVVDTYDVRLTSEGAKESRANVYETDVSRSLDTGTPTPGRNQGGVAVVESFTQDAFSRYSKNTVGASLMAKGGMYGGGSETLVYSTSKSSLHTKAEKNIAATLVATDYKDPPTVSKNSCCTVRRLTPTECARLQGLPDWWCKNLDIPNPTKEELSYWKSVWDEWSKLNGKKPRSESQIKKWLENPHSDSAEYKLYGNGIAVPCAQFVLSAIAFQEKEKREGSRENE